MGWWQRLTDFLGWKLSQSDRSFVNNYLDDAGRFLFDQMSVADQKHAVRVARYILQEAAFRRGLNVERLIQAALIHDAGKVKGEIPWLYRILVGLIRRMAPGYRKKNASRDKTSPLRYALYVDLIHPYRGAYMAESLGIDPEVVRLIKNHHNKEKYDDEPELTLLKTADEKN